MVTKTGPRLGCIGPMVGRHPGHTTMQGLILSDLLAKAGYTVVSASAELNRYSRLVDIVHTLVLNRHNIDILVLEVYGGPSFVVEDIASALGRKFGQRVVMWLQGGAMPQFMARYPRWTRRVLRRAHLLVAPSAYLSRTVADHGFRARVIPNVVDLQAYKYHPRRALQPRLFWMRSFHPIYNPELALRVLARLRNSMPDARLIMAGKDGGCEAEVRNLAERLGLDGAVRFPGFLDMAAKLRAGQDSDIFLNTNRVDNMPVALLEAGAMGLPIVSTAVGGVPDLLTDGQTGLLVPDEDVEGAVRAVELLLKDRGLAEKLSSNGRRLAERSSWEQVRPQWEQIFSELQSSRV
jgi:glycosyltransferase involved in cell wall biosynthesis